MDLVRVSLIVGWTSMVFGALSGAWIGLFFADDRWRGGYPSFDRRLLRLGHIAFFGLGFVNVLFALSERAVPLSPSLRLGAAIGFGVAALTMPLCCFLSAWRRRFLRLFPLPVVSTLIGLFCLLGGWVIP